MHSDGGARGDRRNRGTRGARGGHSDRGTPGGHDGPDEQDEAIEVRVVHPFQAVKVYICPGCQQEIPAGTGHVVVVPKGAADLRRHWHRPCWERRTTRRPGRT
jgi:hypothetical protein